MPAYFTNAQQHFILGGQACLWTENVPTPQHAEYMLLPRLLALAEALWTPQINKDYKRFIMKTELQFERFDKQGINYARSMYNVNIRPQFDSSAKAVNVSLASQTYQYPVYYTTDGTMPTTVSSLYLKPFTINKSSIIKAATYKEGRLVSKINTDTIVVHKAFAAAINMLRANDAFSRLTDGILGTVEPYDQRWVMITDSIATIIIDIKQQQALHDFSMRFMEEPVGYMYLPKSISVSVSADGKHYQSSFAINNTEKPQELRHIKTFSKKLHQEARFIKVEIHNASYNKIAEQNIMMADEIIIK
jgi:hexosaminidase